MNNELQIASSSEIVRKNHTLKGIVDALEAFPLNHYVDGSFSVTDLCEEGGPEDVGFSIAVDFYDSNRNADKYLSLCVEYSLDEEDRFFKEADQVRSVIFSRNITFRHLFDYFEGENYSFNESIGQYVFKHNNKETENGKITKRDDSKSWQTDSGMEH